MSERESRMAEEPAGLKADRATAEQTWLAVKDVEEALRRSVAAAGTLARMALTLEKHAAGSAWTADLQQRLDFASALEHDQITTVDKARLDAIEAAIRFLGRYGGSKKSQAEGLATLEEMRARVARKDTP